MANILINSQGIYVPTGTGVNTGFAKVAYTVCNALSTEHTVGHVCHEHEGLSFEFHNKLLNTTYWVHRGNRNFQESASELKLHVDNRKPDYVIGIGEAWSMYPYKDINFKDTKLLMHVPVDGEPFDSTLNTVAPMADLLIPASHYGKRVCDLNNLPTSQVIPHAFDPTVYNTYKSVQKSEVRAKFGFTDDMFVVGFVGRQQERKNLMALLIAFERFARDKDNVRLLLDITIDSYSDFNIVHMAKFMNLGNKILIIKSNNSSEKEMAAIYNSMDMYISTACSEGFNIPVLEAQACGIPCAVSNYSAHVELVKNHGQLIEISDYRPMSNNIYWAYVDIDKAVESMQFYYDNINARRKDGAAASKFVNKYYTTDIVNKQWLNLINNYDNIKADAESILPISRMDINVE